LVNHRVDNHDVTAGYVIYDVERLRESMQRIHAIFHEGHEKFTP